MTVSGGPVTTAAELVTRAKRLTPLVEEHADEAEASGYRLALAHTTWTCVDLANWIVDAAATVAIRPSVLQRHFRDMKTGAQHMTSGPGVRQNVGRMLAGDQAGKRWMFTELVDER